MQAHDWPQWRGPHRDDISKETGLLKKWPDGGPPLVWKAEGLGGGYSGVSVAKGKVFTMGDGPNATQLMALEEATGKVLWRADVGAPGDGGGYPGPRCTPTVEGDLVFALGQRGDLVCAEVATGKIRWRKSLAKDFDGKMMSGWGYAESPVVDGPRLICTPGGSKGTMIALDKNTGKVLWRTTDLRDNASYASAIVAEIHGVKQYVQLTDASVFGVAADSGKVLWRAERKGRTAVIPTPIASDNHVYVTSGYNAGCNLFRVTANSDAFTARQVYANTDMVNHHGGVILLDGYVYGYSDRGGWTCQEFLTGKVIWTSKALGKGAIAYADGCFYLRAERGAGTLALIEATPQGYRELSRFDQPNRSRQNSWPHPVIANGRLYIRDQDILLCFNVKQ